MLYRYMCNRFPLVSPYIREPHPFISVVGYPVTFQCPSPNFYCFFLFLSSVYFLCTLFSLKNGLVWRYFGPLYISLPAVSLSGPDSTIMSIRHFLPEVINSHHLIIIIA